MVLMTLTEVADFLGVSNARVERLEKEKLLLVKDTDTDGNALFNQADVEKYKALAERLGGI